MQYTTTIVSLLSASGVLALPTARGGNHHGQSSTAITVTLSGESELGTTVLLGTSPRDSRTPDISGPFNTVNLDLASNVPEDLRCQLRDSTGAPITVIRGENTDITFADGNGGPWRFQSASEVSEVICDQSFEKGAAPPAQEDEADLSLRVVLQNQGIELGSGTELTQGVRDEQSPNGASGPFTTVELVVGAQVPKQNYRCQILDDAGVPIVVLRGGNRDITFADGDAGLWRLEKESNVSLIICDPAFVADPLPAQTTGTA